MRKSKIIAVVIPALNEEKSVEKVIRAIPSWVDDIVVADNGSTDKTAVVAKAAGARVVAEPCRGYGLACLSGILGLNNPDIVVFLDGDFSDYPEEMDRLVDPIADEEADLVIGSRNHDGIEPGSLTLPQRFGNWLACLLLGMFWGQRFTDLGPFRAIQFSTLISLGMHDPDYGWTVEMQIKAVRRGLRVLEVPVSYRKRIGKSKVSGTIRGVVGAGYKILGTIFLEGLRAVMARFRY